MSDQHPTRDRIVRLIRDRDGCTISELQRQTGLSRSTLRQHLSHLMRQGMLDGRMERRPTGRPPRIYRLTPRPEPAVPATYAAFLRGLFTGMEQEGRARVEALFSQLAARLVAAHPEIRRLPDLRARLDAARRALFGDVDTSPVEHTDTGIQFSLHTCPLAPVAMEFSDLCCVTRTALTALIGADVEQSEWIIRGDPRCTFEVRTPAPGRASKAA